MSHGGALPSRREIGIVVFLVVCGVLLRLVFPGADAIHPRWHGWMTDEGRWTELAREWALFRSPEMDSPISRIHLLMAPLFQGVVAAAFELWGVGLEVARIPSRIAGIALLLVAVLGLQRALHSWAWVTMTALVAFHPELVYFSRVAIPEMPALLAGFTAFLLVVRPEASRWSDASAGLLTAVAVAFKGTTLLFVPAFALAFLVVDRPRDRRSPLDRLAIWGVGLALPGVLGLGAITVVGGGLPGVGGAVATILGFVQFTGAYDMATVLLYGEATDNVNLLLAVLCPLVVATMLRNPPDSAARRVHRGAMAWALAWLIPLAVLEYFPPRYVVHLHFALILAVAGAVALVSDPRGRPLAQGWTSWSRAQRVVAGTIVALPLAVVLVPPLLVAVDALGPRWDRIRILGPLVLGLALALGGIGSRRPVAWVFGPAFLVFPLATALVWRGLQGPGAQLFWVIDAATALLPWAFAVLGGLGAAWVLERSRRSTTTGMGVAAGCVAYAAALAVLWTGNRHVPVLARPTYELEALSRALTERYPPGEVIGVAKLTGAFLDTPFRYREVFDKDSLPNVMVTTIWSPDLPTPDILAAGFQIVAEFEMPVFLFRGDPRPVDQPLFEDRMPVEVLERVSGKDGGDPVGVPLP